MADDLSLRGLFQTVGLVALHITIRLKPGRCNNWALVTFPAAAIAQAAIATAIRAQDDEEVGSEGKLVDIVVKECNVEQQLLERGSAISGSGQLQSIAASHLAPGKGNG